MSENMQIYIYSLFCVVRNLVSDTEGGTQADGFRERGTEEDIWTNVGRGNGRLENTVYRGPQYFWC